MIDIATQLEKLRPVLADPFAGLPKEGVILLYLV
jgi:hypothetical protein